MPHRPDSRALSSVAACVLWAALGGAASANVAISAAPTSNMSCSSGVCTATAANAVLNIHDLDSMLASSDVTVRTGSVAVNIVSAGFTWASAHSLTLDAYRSIIVNRTITVSGEGGLNLVTNDGGTAGTLSFGNLGAMTFWGISNPLSINGASYALKSSISDLASAIASNPSGNFALAKNYNASPDGTYNAAPINTAYNGRFEGLGNTISRLHIGNVQGTSDVGLFAHLASGGSIENVRLTSLSIAGGSEKSIGGLVGVNDGSLFADSADGTISGASRTNVGMLAGSSSGTIDSSHSSGQVKAAGGNPGDLSFGGMVGVLTGLIERSDSSATVTGFGQNIVGGLVAENDGGTIRNSQASGNVSNGFYAGGLVGRMDAGIATSSHASGDVSDADRAGGLVGELHAGTVTRSGASGSISGSSAGGVVGENFGSIVRCSAIGVVSATLYAGGLGGVNGGTIGQSVATGTVSNALGGPSTAAGGLIAINTGTISNSYATGSVSGEQSGGGFAGRFVSGSLASVYSTGSATGSTFDGGFVGSNEAPPNQGFRNAYWNTTTSGTTQAIGTGNAAPITGLTTAQLQSGLPAGFDPNVWGQSPSINNGFPYLLANPPP